MSEETKKDYSERRKQEIALMIRRIVEATEWTQYELGAACLSSQFMISRLGSCLQARSDKSEVRVARLSVYYRKLQDGKLGKRATFLSARKTLPERLRFTVTEAREEINDTWTQALKDLQYRKENRRKKRQPVGSRKGVNAGVPKPRTKTKSTPKEKPKKTKAPPKLPESKQDKWELFKSLVHELLGIETTATVEAET